MASEIFTTSMGGGSAAPEDRELEPVLHLEVVGDDALNIAPGEPRKRRGLPATARAQIVIATVDAIAVIITALLTAPGVVAGLAYALGSLFMVQLSGGYRARFELRPLEHAPRIIGHLLVLGAVTLSLTVAAGTGVDAAWQAGVTPAALVVGRIVSAAGVRRLRSAGRLVDSVVMIGSGAVAGAIVDGLIKRPAYGLRPVGCVDGACVGTGVPHLGELSDLPAIVERHDVRCVIVAFSQTREHAMVEILRTAVLEGLDVYVVPRFFDVGSALTGDAVDEIWGIPVYRVSSHVRRNVRRGLKRGSDIVLSATAVTVFSPLLLAAAVGVRFTSRGPILYRQPRIGQHGREFAMLKFRTLYVEHCSNTAWSTSGEDTQTPVGKWLRRTNLDELPQLLNILKGDMSLIGPRPERTAFVREFSESVPGYAARHRVPAGLTGWAQIHGLRGDMRIEERARFDNRYIEDWSLWRDLVILAKTALAVLKPSP